MTGPASIIPFPRFGDVAHLGHIELLDPRSRLEAGDLDAGRTREGTSLGAADGEYISHARYAAGAGAQDPLNNSRWSLSHEST
jgi:hypothetical protein